MVEYQAFDISPYGLDEPSLTLFLETTRLEANNIIISKETLVKFGDTTDDGGAYYARSEQVEGIPDVYKVDAEWVEGLKAIVSNTTAVSASN